MSAAEASREASIATLLELHQLCLDQQAQLAFHPSSAAALGGSAGLHTPARNMVSETWWCKNNENSAPGMPSAPHSKSTRPDSRDIETAKRQPQSAPPRGLPNAVLKQHDTNSRPYLMGPCSGDDSDASHVTPAAHPIQLLTEHGVAAASSVAADGAGEAHSKQQVHAPDTQEPSTSANTLQKPQQNQLQDVNLTRGSASSPTCSSSKHMLGQSVPVSPGRHAQTAQAQGGTLDPGDQDKADPLSGSKLKQSGQTAEATRDVVLPAKSGAIAATQLPTRISKHRVIGQGIPVKGRACLLSFTGRKAGIAWRPTKGPRIAVEASSHVSACTPSMPMSLPSEHVSAPELLALATGRQERWPPAGKPRPGSAEGHQHHDIPPAGPAGALLAPAAPCQPSQMSSRAFRPAWEAGVLRPSGFANDKPATFEACHLDMASNSQHAASYDLLGSLGSQLATRTCTGPHEGSSASAASAQQVTPPSQSNDSDLAPQQNQPSATQALQKDLSSLLWSVMQQESRLLWACLSSASPDRRTGCASAADAAPEASRAGDSVLSCQPENAMCGEGPQAAHAGQYGQSCLSETTGPRMVCAAVADPGAAQLQRTALLQQPEHPGSKASAATQHSKRMCPWGDQRPETSPIILQHSSLPEFRHTASERSRPQTSMQSHHLASDVTSSTSDSKSSSGMQLQSLQPEQERPAQQGDQVLYGLSTSLSCHGIHAEHQPLSTQHVQLGEQRQEHLEGLVTELCQERQTVADLQQKLSIVQASLTERQQLVAKAELCETKQNAAGAQHRLAAKTLELGEAVQDKQLLIDAHKAEASKSRAVADALQEQLDEQQHRHDEAVQFFQGQVRDSQGMVSASSQALQDLEVASSEQKDKLELAMQQAKQEKAELEAKLSAAQALGNGMHEHEALAKQQVQDLQRQLASSKQITLDLEQAASAQQAEHDGMRQQQQQVIAQLQAQVHASNQLNEDLHKQLESSKQSASNLQQAASTQQADCAVIQQQQQQQVIAELQAQVLDSNKLLEHLHKQLASSNEAITDLDQAMAAQQADHALVQQQKQQAIAQVEAQVRVSNKLNSDLHEQLSSQGEAMRRMALQSQSLEKQLASKAAVLRKLQDRLKGRRQQVKEAEAKAEAAAGAANMAKSALAKLQDMGRQHAGQALTDLQKLCLLTGDGKQHMSRLGLLPSSWQGNCAGFGYLCRPFCS